MGMNPNNGKMHGPHPMNQRNRSHCEPGDERVVRIYTLGRFSVHSDCQSMALQQSRHQRPFQLLQALIAFGGRAVHEDMLCQALWPDADGDSAKNAFDVTVHRLRRLFDIKDLLIVHDHHLTLNNNLAWVDVWAFEQLVNHSERLLRHAQDPEILQQLATCGEELFSLYQGAFLERESVRPWTLSLRERLRSKLMRHIADTGQAWEAARQLPQAIRVYRKGLEIDPLAESLYQRLIVCLRDSGRIAEALTTFQQCQKAFAEQFQIPPSAKTLELSASLLNYAHHH
jgi:DNA-binding SARP family transcriptional activator